MKIIVQKSLNACVSVNNKIVNKISSGMVLFVGFTHADNEQNLDKMVKKIVNLRIFDDENKIMNKSILEYGGEILSISQFTLYADTNKGNRPSYVNAMKSNEAKKLYELFNQKLNFYVKTYSGIFGADMLISLQNDGPATIILEN